MKLSEYAKKLGISYKTALKYFREGKLKSFQTHTGTIIIQENESRMPLNKMDIYARVSSSENKTDLESQADRLKQYAIARGYQIYKVFKEVGSGFNDNRKNLSTF